MQTRRADLRTANSRQEVPTGFRVGVLREESREPDRQVAGAVARAKEGDMEAIRYLYIRYKDNVYGYVLSLMRDQHEAEDVTQRVFLKLITAIQKYQEREVPFTSWLLRVARNVALDDLRQRRSILCEEVYEPNHEVDDSGRECRWGLQDALQTLPPEQRETVVLRHLVGLTPAEIAERMGRTESSIHGLHHRARRAVQRALVQAECAPTTRATA